MYVVTCVSRRGSVKYLLLPMSKSILCHFTRCLLRPRWYTFLKLWKVRDESVPNIVLDRNKLCVRFHRDGSRFVNTNCPRRCVRAVSICVGASKGVSWGIIEDGMSTACVYMSYFFFPLSFWLTSIVAGTLITAGLNRGRESLPITG